MANVIAKPSLHVWQTIEMVPTVTGSWRGASCVTLRDQKWESVCVIMNIRLSILFFYFFDEQTLDLKQKVHTCRRFWSHTHINNRNWEQLCWQRVRLWHRGGQNYITRGDPRSLSFPLLFRLSCGATYDPSAGRMQCLGTPAELYTSIRRALGRKQGLDGKLEEKSIKS